MTKEETTATWQCWLLDAIHKIRYQKQRPNVERVAACIRMHHPQYSNEAVEEHLEQCVKNGSITKVGIYIIQIQYLVISRKKHSKIQVTMDF